MFSRSDKSDELGDELGAIDSPADRNPLALAVLAGLLAVIGAFLLVRYLSDNGRETASAGVDEPERRQVLVVTDAIPAGTDVAEILESPTTYLAARSVPVEFVAATAITSVEELRELEGLTLESDALAGEQLLRGRFIDRSDFDNESFIERVAAVEAPAGHHTVVLNLPATSALGGNIRPGDKVTIASTFRVVPDGGTPFEIALVVLPTVEIVNVETSAEVIGQVSPSVDSLGRTTVGDFAITVAVEPDELTDLLYAMRYGDIVLAVALEDSTPLDDRPFSTLATIVSGGDFFAESGGADFILRELLDPTQLADSLGIGAAVSDDEAEAGSDAADEADQAATGEADAVEAGVDDLPDDGASDDSSDATDTTTAAGN